MNLQLFMRQLDRNMLGWKYKQWILLELSLLRRLIFFFFFAKIIVNIE